MDELHALLLSSMVTSKGISKGSRQLLDELHRRFRGPFSVADAAGALALDLTRARRLLAHLAAQGWLSRVRRNAYVTVPLGAERPGEWREDPWIVASRVFAPGYLAGWTACEQWGLTEQIFRDVRVVTSKRVRERRHEIQGTVVLVKVVAPERIFGTRKIWRGEVQVEVSDPTRTIVDLLDDPAMGGGVRHVGDVLTAYFDSESRDDEKLASYAEKLGNRTVWKRLGFLLEALAIEAPGLVVLAEREISRGVSLLDPSAPPRGRILTRWNLRLNVDVTRPRP
jgi:predicted transcriptional regulator of viral defense system